MTAVLIDAFSAPPELLLRRVRGVPLVLWPLRILRGMVPLDRVGVMTSDPGIVGLITGHGLYPLPPSPQTRSAPGLILDPLQPFLLPETVRAALNDAGIATAAGGARQTSQFERLRVEDEASFEFIAALARGLPPDHPVIAGIERLRAPLGMDIRAIVCDVDGTLTEGGVTFHTGDESARTFSTRDGLGTEMLQKKGIIVGWLSATSSAASIHARAKQLDIKHVDAGKGDKAPRFIALCAQMGVSPASAIFMGDDANDLPAMALAGLSACPCDAHSSTLNRVDLILEKAGGRGAFRELADIVLAGLR